MQPPALKVLSRPIRAKSQSAVFVGYELMAGPNLRSLYQAIITVAMECVPRSAQAPSPVFCAMKNKRLLKLGSPRPRLQTPDQQKQEVGPTYLFVR